MPSLGVDAVAERLGGLGFEKRAGLIYLIPAVARRDWVVSVGAADAEVADHLVAAVERYGFAFMRAAGDMAGLIAVLRAGHGHAHQIAYRLPVALLAVGGVEEASSCVEDELRAVGDRADSAAEEFRCFVAAFRSTTATHRR